MITVTDNIKRSISSLINEHNETDPEIIFFILDETLGIIDEEYRQCFFPTDEFGGVVYDAAASSAIDSAIFTEINRQLNETRK